MCFVEKGLKSRCLNEYKDLKILTNFKLEVIHKKISVHKRGKLFFDGVSKGTMLPQDKKRKKTVSGGKMVSCLSSFYCQIKLKRCSRWPKTIQQEALCGLVN